MLDAGLDWCMNNGKTNGFKNNLQVIESLETGEQRIYNSVLVDPKNIDIISNNLAMQIVNKLAGTKSCAMDLSRELKQHEQKIYYHIRRLEEAGIIKRAGIERRFGMTAKMFTASSPIISAKLYDDGQTLNSKELSVDYHTAQFFYPFVHEGKLDAKIIVGDTSSHGRFDGEAREGNYGFDLAMLLGGLIRNLKFPSYKLDTEVTEDDLKGNLILIGNPKTNTIIDKINNSLPIFFDESKAFSFVSRSNGTFYDDPTVGLILKINNPLDNTKKILLIGGIKTRGSRAAFLACTKHIKELLEKTDKEGNLMCLVKGVDRDGDRVIDEVKFVD